MAMQDIRELKRVGPSKIVEELKRRSVGLESPEVLRQFVANREAVEKRLESGETESATITEHRRISRNDPCPCGSGVKFKKCCGSRLAADDERID